MIELKCPHCGHQLRIKDKYAGKRGGCKHCRGTFVVPMEASPKPTAEDANFDFDLPVGPPAPPAPPQEKASQKEASASPFNKFGPSEQEERKFKIGGSTGPPPPKIAAPPVEVKVEVSEVPKTTSLSKLDYIPDPPMAAEPPPRTLGVTFWTLVFYLPPVAFVWSFFVEKDHPHRTPGMITSLVFTVIAGSLFAMCFFLFSEKLVELQKRIAESESSYTVEGYGEDYTSDSSYEGSGEDSFFSDR